MPTQKTEQEIQEEEELQLALALSKSEEETKHKEVICFNSIAYCGHLDKLSRDPGRRRTTAGPSPV